MKYFKQFLSLTLLTLFIVSCNSPERSIGMTTWSDDGTEFKFYLGTEQAIDVVKKWDELQTVGDWEGSLELFADTATVTYQTGQTVKASEMTEMARKRDSNMKANNVDYTWTLQGAFSVDLDPTRGGEHVYTDYTMNYDDGEEKGGVNASLRFYIIDGKIVTINQFNQGIIMD
tara:strand:+ start:14 stop:532 length:519 start_codon:yes stop_codon:yes gene_type:complete